MKLKLNRHSQWWLIGLALAGTLAAKNYIDGTRQKPAAAAPTTGGNNRNGTQISIHQEMPIHLVLEQLHRKKNLENADDLFRRKSWYIAPPPVPAAPPPAPVAPPLPFTFLGKVMKPDGSLTLFLSDKNRVYLVHGGETLAHTYHVDGIEHGKLAFTYLPLKKKQYLNIMEAH